MEIGLHVTGAPAFGPVSEAIRSRCASARGPTFDIHGLRGGHTGPGVKTVIPAVAAAKVSFRLVPDQNSSRNLLPGDGLPGSHRPPHASN